jgi:SAM-dependent methyltransferase
LRIAYHRVPADEAFWEGHWSEESLEHLLGVAEQSPLTRHIESWIRPSDRVLEAGCGLGQYVAYLNGRGINITGVDWASSAIERHREAFPASDVRVADLADLPFSDASFDLYLSLGVIEHFEQGPWALLAEAARVLRPGGRAIFSTPYVNLSRRLTRRAIERRQSEATAQGAPFYQFAFDEGSLDELLQRAGFTVSDRRYYDVGRGVRDLRDLARPPAAGGRSTNARRPLVARRSAVRSLLRTKPAVRAFAHMQIVVASRDSREGILSG